MNVAVRCETIDMSRTLILTILGATLTKFEGVNFVVIC